MDSSHGVGEGKEMAQVQTFSTVQQAREYLKNAGYMFAGFGALTQAEIYKRDGAAVLLRRKVGRWVLA